MRISGSITSNIGVGVTYFGAATAAITLTRYDGGVAFLWVASAFLIAVLMVRPRRQWGGLILSAAVGSIFATGLFGFGWALSLPFALANMLEAYVAARLFRQYHNSRIPLGSVPWLLQFVLCVGLAGPVAGSLVAAMAAGSAGYPYGSIFLNSFAGHALGNITFIPLITLAVGGRLRNTLRARNSGEAMETAGLLALVLFVTVVVFSQPGFPILFVPIVPIMLATFRAGQGAAAISIVILALVGGGFTLAGVGPIHVIDASTGENLQFFQFYLAATVLTVLPVAADLRRRAQLHRKLRFSEERYRLLAEYSSDIMMHLEADGRIRFVSPSIRQLGGYEPDELIGRNANVLIAPADLAGVRQAHLATMASAGETHSYDYRAVTRQGEERWFETHSRAVIDEKGKVDGVLSIIRDVSARKATEATLTAAALSDPLTGLPNRRAFCAATEVHLLPGNTSPTSIAIIDIDHFKQVNDRYGHDVGDEVLRSFAAIAQSAMRKGDLVARLGGEEFGLLLPHACTSEAIAICERLREEVASAVTITAGGPVRITFSGGVAELGSEGLDAALKTADEALYRAKAGGRDRMALAA